ncbi:hypothetical protein J3S90_01840 [Flavobacterium sp. P4023]|uniref:Uncharacterized protein n=1 Tax=Flavobacterium flabelliforme TaxID=2816119 RepID=A0ABS5CPL9_9FLAO|nr:hypothetical protein [Flavobacterium flabelliforme]MBP4140539.1 hypothetical protein [Flavobacterium flabelliforme]
MIKSFFSVFMSVLFLLITSQQALVILRFKLNQDVIEKEFCENKNRPELNCHGKCHLKKELKQTESKDLELKNFYKNFDLTFVYRADFVFKAPYFIAFPRKIGYSEIRHSEPYLDVFVPPPLVV